MTQGIRIIPLGGLGEVGKNMTLYETEGGSVLVDAGLAFPRDEHLGVDLVLPDFSYLKDHASDIKAVLLTHAHEDHVGSLPYVLREVPVPRVLATKLTLGLVQSKLDEHGLLARTNLEEIRPEDGPIDVGPFRVDFVRMAHSVPDNVAFVLEAAGLRVLHTSDYKLDHTPVDGFRTDVGKLADLGNRGVDLMLGDSTNAERPGFTGSERLVGDAFRQIIPLRKGRVLIATFASNVHRMQQAIDVALEADRKVCVVGRSMRKNLNIARSLGYLSVTDETLIQPKALGDYPPDKVLVLCTGSQGEPLSALTRIAYHDHASVQVERGDTVIISAKPVPGNELRVHDTINQLARAGAEILHQEIAPVHVSGHGNSEEIRTVLALVRPKGVMPVHGEYRMQAAQARMAGDIGVPAASIVLAENGSVVELTKQGVSIVDHVDSGVTFVDGLSVGDLSDVALRDRRRLSEDGVLIVVATLTSSNGSRSASPELIARGFTDAEGPLLEEMRVEAEEILDACIADDILEIKLLQEHLHDGIGQLVYDRTRRRPMILPIVVEV